MIVDFTLEYAEQPEIKIEQELAHGWVTDLTDRMLRQMPGSNHAEFGLRTDMHNAKEILAAMTLDDLLLPAGTLVGHPRQVTWYTGPEESIHDDKMGMYYRNTFVLPREPSSIFMSATTEQIAEDGEDPTRFLSIGFEYALPSNKRYRQMIGVVAHPERHVDAMRLVYGETEEERIILGSGYSRAIAHLDAREFVSCMNELYIILRRNNA